MGKDKVIQNIQDPLRVRFVSDSRYNLMMEVRDENNEFSHFEVGDLILVMVRNPAFYRLVGHIGKWLIMSYQFPVIGMDKRKYISHYTSVSGV